MRIVLISLPDSTERRDAARKQFGDTGLEFEFFDGINGRTATTPLFDSIDEASYLLNAGRLPSKGEIGCHASHRAVWKYCIDLDEPVIILEDDAKLESNFAAAAKQVETLISDYGFIRLQHLRHHPKKKVCNAGDFELFYCEKYPHGAVGYAVNPAAAKALYEHSSTLTAPADKFIKNFWQHGQPMYCLLPESITPGILNEESTIEGRDKPPSSLALRLKRIGFKLGSAIKRAAFNRAHGPR